MFAYIDSKNVLQIIAADGCESDDILDWWARTFTTAGDPRKNVNPEITITYYDYDS